MLVMKWKQDGEGHLIARWITEPARDEPTAAPAQMKTTHRRRRSRWRATRSRVRSVLACD